MFRAGQQIGSYTLIQRIGRGGFGEVWLAERRAKFVTTKVALKLPLDEQVDHEAIKQESILWEQASGHPNVLPIIDADEYDGQVVIVSEYAPDGSLDELLKRNGGALPIKLGLALTIGILNGLEFLHSKKIVHRDLKPGNILLQGETPRLADFGISRVMKTTSQSAQVAGTPCYMSPEAFDGKRNAQTDIWSAGVILYQMLTGIVPFRRSNYGELIHAIINSEPATLPAAVPTTLHKIVLKALAKQTAERYQTAREMRDALSVFLIMHLQSQQTPPPQNAIASKTTEEKTTVENSVLPERDERNRQSQTPFTPLPVAAKDKSRINIKPLRVLSIVLLLATVIGVSLIVANKPNAVSRDSAATDPARVGATNQDSMDAGQPNSTSSLSVDSLKNILIPFRKGDKFGFSDANKKTIIEPKYDDVIRSSDGLTRVVLNNKHGLVDKTGKEIVAPKYDDIGSFSEELAPIKLNGKWGYIDKFGKVMVAPQYDDARSFSDGLAAVRFTDRPRSTGRINKKAGQQARTLPPSFFSNPSLDSILFPPSGGKWGFIDQTGRAAIPPKYYGVFPILNTPDVPEFHGGLAAVKINGKYGFMGKDGKVVITPQYDYASSFSDGLAEVTLKGKRGFIDKDGKVIIDFKYHYIESFSEGVAPVKLDEKWGYIDKAGNEIVTPHYDSVSSFSDGLARVGFNNKYGYIDKEGKVIIDLIYEDAGSFSAMSRFVLGENTKKWGFVYGGLFSEGLARVRLNEKWGFVDKNGNVVIIPQYDYAQSFSDGLALVQLNDKWSYIDKFGKEIIPLKYDKAWSFRDGRALVELDGKYGFIDKIGKEVIAPKYYYHSPQLEGIGRKKIRLDNGEKYSNPPIEFFDGLAAVWRNDKRFYIDKNGIEYYEP